MEPNQKKSQRSTYCEYCGDFHESLHEFTSEVSVGETIPDYEFEALRQGEAVATKFSSFRGSWLVVVFYTAGFSPESLQELEDLAAVHEELRALGADVVALSTDSLFTHMAWRDSVETIRDLPFAMGADPSGKIASAFGVLVEGGDLPFTEEEGLALPSTFIIDPKGVLRVMEVHDAGILRSTQEVLRKIRAAQGVDAGLG